MVQNPLDRQKVMSLWKKLLPYSFQNMKAECLLECLFWRKKCVMDRGEVVQSL
jgi:hypothetical protein